MPNLVIINPFTGRIQTARGSVRFRPTATRSPSLKPVVIPESEIDPEAQAFIERRQQEQQQRETEVSAPGGQTLATGLEMSAAPPTIQQPKPSTSILNQSLVQPSLVSQPTPTFQGPQTSAQAPMTTSTGLGQGGIPEFDPTSKDLPRFKRKGEGGEIAPGLFMKAVENVRRRSEKESATFLDIERRTPQVVKDIGVGIGIGFSTVALTRRLPPSVTSSVAFKSVERGLGTLFVGSKVTQFGLAPTKKEKLKVIGKTGIELASFGVGGVLAGGTGVQTALFKKRGVVEFKGLTKQEGRTLFAGDKQVTTTKGIFLGEAETFVPVGKYKLFKEPVKNIVSRVKFKGDQQDVAGLSKIKFKVKGYQEKFTGVIEGKISGKKGVLITELVGGPKKKPVRVKEISSFKIKIPKEPEQIQILKEFQGEPIHKTLEFGEFRIEALSKSRVLKKPEFIIAKFPTKVKYGLKQKGKISELSEVGQFGVELTTPKIIKQTLPGAIKIKRIVPGVSEQIFKSKGVGFKTSVLDVTKEQKVRKTKLEEAFFPFKPEEKRVTASLGVGLLEPQIKFKVQPKLKPSTSKLLPSISGIKARQLAGEAIKVSRISRTKPIVSYKFIPINLPKSRGKSIADIKPDIKPGLKPSLKPALKPSLKPSLLPILKPALKPALKPSLKPALKPTLKPALKPSLKPSLIQLKTKAPLVPKFKLGPLRRKKIKTKSLLNRKFRYQPSLVAVAKKIKGKRIDETRLTGLEIRKIRF